MANKKKEYYRPSPMTDGKRKIIQGLLQEYDIESASDIQEALKDLLGGTIKGMMEAEMDDHLGYEKSARSDNDDYRNGYKKKRITTSYGGTISASALCGMRITAVPELLRQVKQTCRQKLAERS